MVKIETKLSKILLGHFNDAGLKFLEIKKRQNKIKNLDDLEIYEQQRFIIELVHDLYSDMISNKRYNEVLSNIFNEIYGFSESEHALLWRKFFKGIPPINFMYSFFGQDIGKDLILIEEEVEKIDDIKKEEDALQYSFIIKLITRLLFEEKELIDDLKSLFMEYLLEGSDKMNFKFNDFLKINKDKIKKINNSINRFIKMHDEEISSLSRITGLFEVNNKNIRELKGMGDEEEVYLFKNIEKSIQNELGKYISNSESVSIINDAKKSANIVGFPDATVEQKLKFMNYILNNSSIMSYSEQKERMIKQWLRRLLKI